MVWFFERGVEATQFEVRRSPTHFEIAVRRPDGKEIVHIARSPGQLVANLATMPRALLREGWRPRPADPTRRPSSPQTPRHGTKLP